jgi:hypothetical protein
MPQDQLKPLRELRKQLADAIVQYERHIPTAKGKWRTDLLWHRDLHLRILADLTRLPDAAGTA